MGVPVSGGGGGGGRTAQDLGEHGPFEPFWCRHRSLFAVGFSELMGTCLLVYCIALSLKWSPSDTAQPFAVAGVVLCLCNIFGDLSGAHFNPNITVAYFLVEIKFSAVRMFTYLAAEIMGAIAGLALANLNDGGPTKNPYSVKAHSDKFGVLQIGLSEAIWSAILSLTALRAGFLLPEPPTLTPLWIAGVILAGAFAGGTISGCCMNPALAIAFALHAGSWLDVFVYCLSGTLGAVMAALFSMLVDPAIWVRRVGLAPSAAELYANSSLPIRQEAGTELTPNPFFDPKVGHGLYAEGSDTEVATVPIRAETVHASLFQRGKAPSNGLISR